MNYYIECLKKYAVFDGRSQRAAYWYFFLFNLIVSVVLGFIDTFMGLADPTTGYGPISGLYTLAVFVPGVAVTARRLHDIDRSGWWMLIIFVPIIGFLVLLYWTVKDSDAGENQYGPNPKNMAATKV